jgi:predicted Zn-dependent protease
MKQIALLFVMTMCLLLGCATTGPGGKKSLILIPTNQEVAIGAGMDEQIHSSEQVLPDTVWQNYVSDIGRRLVSVCDRRDVEYHFTVIQSDVINAFAAPGGYVYIYTGLLRQMNTEAELAAVMAHEISHVVARHSIKRVQAAMGVQLAYQLIFGGEGAGQAYDAAISIGLNLAFADYSRDNEREADHYGIHYMRAAGYDPNGALAMFETLARLGGAGYSNVFEKLAASHPATQERINNARAQIAEMQPLPGDLSVGREKYRQMLQRLPESPKPQGQ